MAKFPWQAAFPLYKVIKSYISKITNTKQLQVIRI